MTNDCSYWQIRHKQKSHRNVWVSGVAGTCDHPEDAMKMAVGCKEIAENDTDNWDILRCASWEDIQARIAKGIPKKLRHLPVYDWDDDHDEAEWISIGPDGRLWHRIGGHCRSISPGS